jgi:hypothetical protein
MKNFRRSSESLTRIAANLDSTSRHANALIAGIDQPQDILIRAADSGELTATHGASSWS